MYWKDYGYASFSAAFCAHITYAYWFRRLTLFFQWHFQDDAVHAAGLAGPRPYRTCRLVPPPPVPTGRNLVVDLVLYFDVFEVCDIVLVLPTGVMPVY